MELIKKEFNFPERYDLSFMARLNKRERDLLERRNNDIEFTNRPTIENPFLIQNEEEELNNKKEVKEILNYIPISTINEQKQLSNNNNKCMICLSNYKLRDKISTLPCWHNFHSKCFEKWMVQKRCCPICKFEISLQSLFSLDENDYN